MRLPGRAQSEGPRVRIAPGKAIWYLKSFISARGGSARGWHARLAPRNRGLILDTARTRNQCKYQGAPETLLTNKDNFSAQEALWPPLLPSLTSCCLRIADWDTHMHRPVHTHTNTRTCAQMYTHERTHAYTWVHVYIHVCPYEQTHAYHARANTYTCAHMHAHICTDPHTC